MGDPDRPRTGLRALKAQVAVRGLSAIDKRTLAAQHLLGFHRELLNDLGCEAAVSAAQADGSHTRLSRPGLQGNAPAGHH